MPVRVIVGPEFDAGRIADAVEAWRKLAEGAPELVVDFVPDFRPCDHRINSIAASLLEYDLAYKPTNGLLVLGERFFEMQDESRQTLTMLHEVIHLVLKLGPLASRSVESEKLYQSESRRLGGNPTDFQFGQHTVAKCFRLFAEEVLAEQFLRRRRPQNAEARVAMYREMRERSAPTILENVPSEFHCFGKLYEMVRNDLGTSISARAEDRTAFEQLAEGFRGQLEARCSDGADQLAMRPRLLGVDLDRPPYDFTPFDQMWDRVMRVTPGN